MRKGREGYGSWRGIYGAIMIMDFFLGDVRMSDGE